MWSNLFGYTRPLMRFSAGVANSVARDWSTINFAREQPFLGSGNRPVAGQDIEQPLGQHDIAVLLALALFYPQHHALPVDGAATLQVCGLRDPQSCRIAGGQDRAAA